MPIETLITCCWILAARIGDQSLGTLRMVAVVHGARGVAFVLGFCEVLIWVFAASTVLANLREPAYAVAYALGFATGNFVGISLERWFAFGRQAVRIITRSDTLAAELRGSGFIVTVFAGSGRDGPVNELFTQVPRRAVASVIRSAREHDPACYYVVDDVRVTSSSHHSRGFWTGILKSK